MSASEPGSPEGFREEKIGDTWVELSWRVPTRPAANIVGYHVYFESEQGGKRQLTGRDIDTAEEAVVFNLTGLSKQSDALLALLVMLISLQHNAKGSRLYFVGFRVHSSNKSMDCDAQECDVTVPFNTFPPYIPCIPQ